MAPLECATEEEHMPRPRPSVVELLTASLAALGTSQMALAGQLGSSRRTMTRWLGGLSVPSADKLLALARLVAPRDRALGERIAAVVGTTLPPPDGGATAAPAPARNALCDSVVCAGADAMDLSPRALRPALHAAMRRARELGLTVAELEAGLAPPAAPPQRGRTS